MLRVRVVKSPKNDGRTHIDRYGDYDLETTVRTALKQKLSKLTKTTADRRILMLERDQMRLANSDIAQEVQRQSKHFPELGSVDVWLVEVFDNRRSIGFEPARYDGSYALEYLFYDGQLI